MKPSFSYGTEVRLTRNVRNDGTYPGEEVGRLLVRRGAVGAIYDVGSYLQDQIIYRVHFLDEGRTVGCREEELILASDPWIPNKYEFREKVVAIQTLAIKGEVIVEAGDPGEVESIVKEQGKPVAYHVRFHGRVFKIPEALLQPLENTDSKAQAG